MNEISTNAVTHPPRAAQRAAAREAARAAAIESAAIGYPPELPVSQRRDDIAAAIRDHQVVIVAGETGSGKTTQLPKICLELGRGVAGQIGHTQPRRIAARTVAERIAEELKTDLGDVVGYKVRFTDKSGDNTAVKLMTDGILLAEIGSDREPAPLRHPDHRRGPRAVAEHRLHPRLPQAAAAPPPRPQGHHHLRHDRPRAVRRALQGPAHRAARPDHRGLRPDLPGRGPLPPGQRRRGAARKKTATRSRPSPTRSASSSARARATSSSSSPASGRSATPPTRSRAGQDRRAAALLPAVGGRAAPGVRAAEIVAAAPASCSPPTSPRPRSPCPASAT